MYYNRKFNGEERDFGMIKLKNKIYSIILVLFCIGVVGCIKQIENNKDTKLTQNEPSYNIRTDMETLQKWFPSLQGIKSAEWKVDILGENKYKVPGPSSYHAYGLIILEEEQAKEYFSEYEWEPISLDTKRYSDFQNISEEAEWFYSLSWQDSVKPAYYIGKFYLSKDAILFDIVR